MNKRKQMVSMLGICASGVILASAIGLKASALEIPSAGDLLSTGDLSSVGGATTMFYGTMDEAEYLAAAEAAQGALWGYTNLGIADVDSGNLNVRAIPGIDGKLVGKMPKDSACEVIAVTEDGCWAQIVSGEVEGYVSTEYLYMGADAGMRALELVKTVATVNVDGLRVRDEASRESAIMTTVPKGEELEVIEVLEDWVKVSIDGTEAYVSAEYVTVEEKLKTAVTMSELRYGQGVSELRVDLVEYAKQFLGNPYVYGGTSLTKGIDCSAFVMQVYKHFGITLPRTSSAQAKEGTKITASELQPGDLIFYADSSGHIDHVALYIGGGKVIQASSPSTGIIISNYKYRTPAKYVRIIKE